MALEAFFRSVSWPQAITASCHTHALSAFGTISVFRRDGISGLTFYIELPQVLPLSDPVSVTISSELQQKRPVVTSVRQVEYSAFHSQSVYGFTRAMPATIAASAFRYSPKNAAPNRLSGPKTSSNFADPIPKTPLPRATVDSSHSFRATPHPLPQAVICVNV